ncbi:MAG: anhydro-N-acetylmuramic acid kinase [Bauldia litoralis]
MAMRTAIGLMSGTSMDGVDAALVRTDGAAAIEPFGSLTLPYPAALRRELAAVLGRKAAPRPLVDAITEVHRQAVAALLAQDGMEAGAIDIVGLHGHTLFHDPGAGCTVQIGDASALATATGIDVVSDFRSNDVARGGQGAPFAPLYHAALAAGLDKPVAVLNVGGVANVTWIGAGFDIAAEPLDPDAILAFDTGPGNALIDDWIRRHTGGDFDADGQLARSGQVSGEAVAAMLDLPYFAAVPPKSLDRNSFDLTAVDGLSAGDGAATLVAITVEAAARSARHFPAPVVRWLVCGGGRRNGAIMAALAEALDAPVEPVEAVGWNGDALEAQAFAWLAVRSLDGLPLSLPTTTGVDAPCPGGVIVRAKG